MIQVSSFNSQKLSGPCQRFSVGLGQIVRSHVSNNLLRNRINPFRGTVCGLYWKQITAL